MFQRLSLLFLFSSIHLVAIFGDDTDVQISGSNDKCAEFCSKTYPAHTFDHSGAGQSCQQGCRLFSVIQFADKMKQQLVAGDRLPQSDEEQINSTAIFNGCERECNDAYSDEIFKSACVDGCQHQAPSMTGEVRVVIDDSSPVFPIANRLINDAMSQFGDFKDRVKAHLENLKNFFNNEDPVVSSDDNKGDTDDAKIFKQPLQTFGDGFFKLFNDLNNFDKQDSENKETKPRLFGGKEDVADRNRNLTGEPIVFQSRPKHQDGKEFEGPTSVGNEDENGDQIIVVKMIPIDGESQEDASAIIPEAIPPSSGDVINGSDDGWLACLSRRSQNLSMLSRWLLCAALMMSVLCMIWLCLAFMRNQRQRRRLYMQYRAGKSDLIYFMPPPTYEKTPSSAAYLPLNKDQKEPPPSPPPAYKQLLEEVAVKTETPKTENA